MITHVRLTERQYVGSGSATQDLRAAEGWSLRFDDSGRDGVWATHGSRTYWVPSSALAYVEVTEVKESDAEPDGSAAGAGSRRGRPKKPASDIPA
jgi:hypothetical protein